MKNIVSLLAVALFATVFAVGCGKKDKCTDVTVEADCKNESFVDGLKDKCGWKDGKCVDKAAADKKAADDKAAADKKAADDKAADEAKCVAAKADTNTCTAASATLVNKATHECKFTPETTNGAGDQKCLLVAKANP